uniref:Thioredoxin domain-containing protein n=1 Tax=Pseudo-nitzschia australis TaxID=44445 RepID=A0A7S4ARI3_9STRA|mmetsp:Transcript_8194/g.17685  ORF Transcript_8194/g.17685 Transcript_8194/m.17685 type:complete len:767 (-) Transcript_8194:2372-4672(-)
MLTTHSKSRVVIASFVALASASNNCVADAARPFATSAFVPKTRRNLPSMNHRSMLELRGGEDATINAETETSPDGEKTLDEKVYAAMEKLGLSAPSTGDDMECKDGVCAIPEQEQQSKPEVDPTEMADLIAKEMNVDSHLAMAAIAATSIIGDGDKRTFDESAARAMIQQELELIETIPEDSENVKTLTEEGFDVFMTRRALAFAENNVEDARAILLADQMDAEEEEQEKAAVLAGAESPTSTATAETESDFVEVKTNFDPTKLPASTPTPAPVGTPKSNESNNLPKPAKKEDVVFEATTAELQQLVLESPVPVLLDIYADWCGPCKVLGPALEDMAIKSGGMFRLVKVNSDNERPVSQALEVTALPTVFGIKDGKIVHMFQGMPKSEDMMRNFMMGLFGAAPFSPPVTTDEKEKYEEMTKNLIKVASAASFSFEARERLTDRIGTKMDELVKDDSVTDVEDAARLIRTFLNNVVNNPYEQKYRKINLENKVVASKIGGNRSCLAVLKSVGYTKSGTAMVLKKNQKVINVAPLVVARDTIDKWIQRNQKEMAAAARKRQDELDRANLDLEEVVDDEEESEEVEEIDPTLCRLKLRLDGKNKIHDAVLHQDDPLTKVLDELDVTLEEDEVQITCVAKRLVVKSSDKEAMKKTLGEHGLTPAANIVVKVGGSSKADTSSMKGRVADKKIRKTGSHTMQSIGIYAKDDNNKAELIDGGGGTWYEHDISDDEEEGEDSKDEAGDNNEEKKDAETTSSGEKSEEEPSVETE